MLLAALAAALTIGSPPTPVNCDIAADSLPASRAKVPKLREWAIVGPPPVTYAGLKIGRDWRGGLLCNDLVPADGCQRWQVEVAVRGGKAAVREPGAAHGWTLVVTRTGWGKAVLPPLNAPLELQIGRARCQLAPVGAGQAARVEKSGLRVVEHTVYYPVDAGLVAAIANAGSPKFHLAGATITVEQESIEDLQALVHALVRPEHLVDWSGALETAVTAAGLGPPLTAADTLHRLPAAGRWLGWLNRSTSTDGRLLAWAAYPVARGAPAPVLAGDTVGLVGLREGEVAHAVVRARAYRSYPNSQRTPAWAVALEPLSPLPEGTGRLAAVSNGESWTALALENRAALTSFAESYGLALDRQLEKEPAPARADIKTAALARLDSLAAPGFAGPDGDVFVLWVPPLVRAGTTRLPAMLFLVDNEGAIRHRMVDAPPAVGVTSGQSAVIWLASGAVRWVGDRWADSR
jgi:hypothetical protein